MKTISDIILVGIGNSLRADDGVGEYVCFILKNKYPLINALIVHQLDITMLNELNQFSSVIFIDASIETSQVTFDRISEHTSGPSFSHHVNANMIAELNKQLYNSNTEFYLCSVGADDFNFSTHISNNTKLNGDKAIELINEWIIKHFNSAE